ncbi:hypothetical protein DMTZ50_1234 [Dehalococcoides mccartyi]|uniref:Uncharacterized protein n=1 Tax=Dehalococcoides mccartyi TaxID=61435 RepID=A0A142VAH0_9CHLR|nr:hypothetical protein Dm11a5_1010 [Dehalococcoides mccartyi]AOV99625.1 hypothetical protein DCWBC2_0998 [Dehalococcoides mccartyi]MBA2085405.1 hypothetical protein [Dehalococcoides mccartyi]
MTLKKQPPPKNRRGLNFFNSAPVFRNHRNGRYLKQGALLAGGFPLTVGGTAPVLHRISVPFNPIKRGASGKYFYSFINQKLLYDVCL